MKVSETENFTQSRGSSTAPYNIREFNPTDIQGALLLWEQTKNIGLSDSDAPDNLEFFLERNPGLSYVAVTAGEVVGTILCGHDGRRGYIYHLAVNSEYRRAGIGRVLLSKSLEALKENGILKCHAFVFRENPYGELFWGAGGWQPRNDLLTYSKFIEN